jgi:hypothetical protein
MPDENTHHLDFSKLLAVVAVFAVLLGLVIGGTVVLGPQLVHSRQTRDDEPEERPDWHDRDDHASDAESGARAAKLGLSSLSNPFHRDDKRSVEWLGGYMRQRERGGWGSGATAPATAKDPNAK